MLYQTGSVVALLRTELNVINMKLFAILVVSLVLFGFVLPVKRDKTTALSTTKPTGKADGPYVLYSSLMERRFPVRDTASIHFNWRVLKPN